MDQEQRDKIAWGLAVVFGLVLIYLLAVNVFKVGKKSAPSTSSTMTTAIPSQPAPISVGEQVPNQVPEPALDPKVLAEQQQISARLPRRNPFSAADAGQQTTDDGQRMTVNNEIKLKVSAIISRPGSNKRIAMINGKMIEEGERIGEWTILKVNPNNVVLGNGSQQMVIGVK